MIRDIIKKIERLARFNRALQLKLIGCAVLLMAAGAQGRMLKTLDQTGAEVKDEWDLVLQVPVMEKKLKTENLKLLQPERQIIAIKSILEGTSFRNNVYQAIIDGEVYSTGDTIGDYKIINITLKTITLENSKIFEIKELSFPEKPGDQTKL